MISIYEQTQQGKQTRSRLLNHISPDEELSREDLVTRSGLSYDQVRRQTKNLCIDGVLKSRIEGGKRLYRLRVPGNLKQVVSVFLVALAVSWAIGVPEKSKGTKNALQHSHTHHTRTA